VDTLNPAHARDGRAPLRGHSRTLAHSDDLPLDEDAGANRSVDEYSAAGEGAEGALEDEVAELEERWCELTERIRCRRIG
jgi:hypothetical protein